MVLASYSRSLTREPAHVGLGGDRVGRNSVLGKGDAESLRFLSCEFLGLASLLPPVEVSGLPEEDQRSAFKTRRNKVIGRDRWRVHKDPESPRAGGCVSSAPNLPG